MRKATVEWLGSAEMDLDNLYIEARYPGDLGLLPNGKPTLEDSRGFFEVAQAVHTQVVGKLTAGTK